MSNLADETSQNTLINQCNVWLSPILT